MPTYSGTYATGTAVTPYYQTRTYLELFKSLSYVSGIEPDDVLTDEAEAIRDFLNAYLREAWEMYPWPQLMQVLTTTYLNRNDYVEYDIFSISLYDPRDKKDFGAYTWSLDAAGINIIPDLSDTSELYIRYRLPFYRLGGAEFDAESGSYSTGEMVYDPDTGDYYRSLQDSNTAGLTDTSWWDRRYIPDFIYEFAKNKGLADLREAQGQGEKARSLRANADYALKLEIDKWERQKNLQLRPHFRNRSGG